MLVILQLSIVTDVPREKAYHLKPRLLGKDDKLEGDAALNKFFREIYLNSDEDIRSDRQIIFLPNQQVESIGTVLSIDWKDVGAKKIEALFMMIWCSRHGKYNLI
ncbi:hypothetical protein YC2023_122560 [Brassica napus]